MLRTTIGVFLVLSMLIDADTLSYKLVRDWPFGIQDDGELPFSIGQVSGVAMTTDESEVVLFHRADRQWDQWAFDWSNIVRRSYRTPIPTKTLVWVDNETGKVTKKAGENLFYLPHGITIDGKGFIWITDVGSHQMYKLSPKLEVVLTIGVRFVPGSDKKHLCKPTDVAVQINGNFFVGDGYCNSRVLEFNSKGKVVQVISTESAVNDGLVPYPKRMVVVHSISLDPTNNLLYVADREDGRVLVFDIATGKYKDEIKAPNGGAIYTVRYNQHQGGVVHFVTGPRGSVQRGMGYTISVKDKKVLSTWSTPGGFSLAHAMTVSGNNKEIFVVEIHPNRAWKFTKVNHPRRR